MVSLEQLIGFREYILEDHSDFFDNYIGWDCKNGKIIVIHPNVFIVGSDQINLIPPGQELILQTSIDPDTRKSYDQLYHEHLKFINRKNIWAGSIVFLLLAVFVLTLFSK